VTGSFDGSDHDVEVLDGTLASSVIGGGRHATKSHHHQGVQRIGKGLRVGARSAVGDDLVEAIELPDRSFVLGVQWHPEADPSSPVIDGFLEAARAHAHARRVVP
jgi:putative glutamine amidotransferase